MSIADTTALPQPGTLPLPVGWVPLAPHGADPSDWVEGYLNSLREQPTAIVRAQLRYSLLTVMELAATMRPGKRYNFALLEDPELGAVRALLSVQMLRTPASQMENYRARLEEADQNDSIQVLNREVFDVQFDAGHGIAMHDFTVSAEIEAVPDPALERTIIGLFVTGEDVLIEFSLYAQDLSVFDNMSQYLVDIIATLDISGVNQ
jgi:hypothetical protein